jgi:hypothetical protein
MGFDAIAAGTAYVELLRQTTDGTATASTKVRWDTDDPAPPWTAFHHFTAEPTSGEVLASYECPENGGQLILQYPLGREPMVAAATTSRIALRATPTQVCNVTGYLVAA